MRYIAPKHDKNYPAVFSEEICRRVLKYYSFEGDVVMDPFTRSGTFGRAARKMGKILMLCEINEQYAGIMEKESADYYIPVVTSN